MPNVFHFSSRQNPAWSLIFAMLLALSAALTLQAQELRVVSTSISPGANPAATTLGVPLEAFTVGAGDGLDDVDGSWPAAYGVGRDGAVLVRPDAHVGWRARSAGLDPARELEAALQSMLGRA